MKIELTCDMCGKKIIKYLSQIKNKKHHFCSRLCASNYTNKLKNPEHYKEARNLKAIGESLSKTNKRLNPTRMTPEIKEKISNSRIKKLRNINNKSYFKKNSKHIHRIIAEEILGRPLEKGEVVHHIDGNIHNNSKENLIIFKNQSEHMKWHIEHDNLGINTRFKKKGGE